MNEIIEEHYFDNCSITSCWLTSIIKLQCAMNKRFVRFDVYLQPKENFSSTFFKYDE
jgi:hypothetical protein